VPLPKKTKVTGLNDYRLVALTPIAMKCLENLVMTHINLFVYMPTCLYALYAYLLYFSFLKKTAPFAVNTVNSMDILILIDPIQFMIIVLFCCTFRGASPLFNFTAHPVCVCDE